MRRAAILSVLTLGLAALAGQGCSGSTASVSADQACTDAANALCAKLNMCSALFVQIVFGDVSTCVSRSHAPCASGLSAHGTGASPSTLEACAQAIPGASCTDVLSHNTPAACKPLMGQLANGTACGDSSQCQSGYCNQGTGIGQKSTCGVCGTQAAAGGACKVDDDCPYGAKCNTAQVCVTLGAAGATCDGTHPCQGTLACKGGTCATPDAAGQACTVDASGQSCDTNQGQFCNLTNKVCQMIGTAGPGQPCGFVSGGLVACTGAGLCKTSSTPGTSGTCLAPAADGASCDPLMGPSCLPPALCTGGKCTLADPSSCK
jgi:hypothetical protein